VENQVSKSYLISYDLDQPGRDYSKFLNEIERLGGIRILYAEWMLKCNFSAVRLRDHLNHFIDADDRLVVLGLTGEAAWTSLMISDQRLKQFIAA
jgi:hypothetical protein